MEIKKWSEKIFTCHCLINDHSGPINWEGLVRSFWRSITFTSIIIRPLIIYSGHECGEKPPKLFIIGFFLTIASLTVFLTRSKESGSEIQSSDRVPERAKPSYQPGTENDRLDLPDKPVKHYGPSPETRAIFCHSLYIVTITFWAYIPSKRINSDQIWSSVILIFCNALIYHTFHLMNSLILVIIKEKIILRLVGISILLSFLIFGALFVISWIIWIFGL